MKFTIKLFLVFFFLGCATTQDVVQALPKQDAATELRGVWIASVLNIDWPAASNLSIAQLKTSYGEILDFYQALHFNAVFVQIRTAGDALYSSDFAPWSRFVSGKEGRALDEDILPWLIDQAHHRGMEFHAWMNPYRASTSLDTTLLSPDHAFYQHRDWMIKYGNKYYFNPALKPVQDHLLNVINEVTTKYDVDGIHFDDYFYPYRIKNEQFADSTSFAHRVDKIMGLADWRRNNINQFIQSCYQNIKVVKPHVQFGVSPFGVWRNKKMDSSGSDSRAGQTVYDDLYADTRKWIQNGWLDYIAPQLYWSMDYPAASHRKLVNWWTEEANSLPLYIGLGAYKVENNADTSWNDLTELVQQINYGRETKTDGYIVFSAKSMMQKPILTKLLKEQVFQADVLTETQMLWKQSTLNIKHEISRNRRTQRIEFSSIDPRAKVLVISYDVRKGLFGKQKTIIESVPIKDGKVELELHKRIKKIALQGVNSTNIKTNRKLLTLEK